MIKYDTLRQKYISDMAKIEAECFSDPWSAEMLSSELTNPLAFYIIALDGDTVAGYAGMHEVLDEAYITNIAVRSSHRRRGIARELIELLFRECRKKGVDYITLEVRESNAAAQSLYENAGFTRCGRRLKYYGDEDAVIMSRYGLTKQN